MAPIVFHYFRAARCFVGPLTPLQACNAAYSEHLPRLVGWHVGFGFGDTRLHLSVCAHRAVVAVVPERRRLKDHPQRVSALVGGSLIGADVAASARDSGQSLPQCLSEPQR